MAKKTTTTTNSSSQSTSQSQSQSQSQAQSTTQKTLDQELLAAILQGLQGTGYEAKTEEELMEAAQNLFLPEYNAQVEAAKQEQAATDLGLAQQIENLIAAAGRQVDQQNAAFNQSRADIETGALARGMGRSSYTLSTLSNNDIARAAAIDQIMGDVTRQQGQLEAQRTQAAQQLAQTLGRLETDKATNIKNTLLDLLDREYDRQQSAINQQNQNWLTALEMAMGTKTNTSETSQTQGTENTTTNSTQTSTTMTGSGGSGGSSSSSKGSGSGGSTWDDLLDMIMGDQKKTSSTNMGGGSSSLGHANKIQYMQ